MRKSHAYLLFAGTLLTALGYGATFLLTEHFRALGGSEIDTGTTLVGAMTGTLIGVALVGWFADRIGAARMAAAGAVSVAGGYLWLAWLTALMPATTAAGFFIGLGWGTFYLAAPMALSARVGDRERGFWFLRFGAFQMAGIGLSPILATALIDRLGFTTGQAFAIVAAACLLAALLLVAFEAVSPQPRDAAASGAGRWVRALPPLARTPALYPILMVGLGACVFTGLQTFQTSLVRGTGLAASTYFAAYTLTVVVSRFTLAPLVNRADSNRAAVVLLVLMSLGVAVAFFFALGIALQILSAVLLGLGYGLVYSVIQTQVINDAPPALRGAALTWFVIAYFIGIFGFPMLGGWLIVTSGIAWFLMVVLMLALMELALAVLRRFSASKPASDELRRQA